MKTLLKFLLNCIAGGGLGTMNAAAEEVTSSPRKRLRGPATAPAPTIHRPGLVSLQQLAMKLAHQTHLMLPTAQHICWTDRLGDEKNTLVSERGGLERGEG
jgi:hypothetical protein